MKHLKKQILCFTLAAVMFIAGVASANLFSKATSDYPLGDLNGDYDVNAADALLVLQRAVNKIDRFPIEASTDVQTPTDTDAKPDGEYRTFEELLADARREDSNINPNLLYTSTVPAGYSANSIDSMTNYVAYHYGYDYQGEPTPQEITVIGIHFFFYDENDNCFNEENYSATQQAIKLAEKEKNQHISVFTLPDGREVLMYAVIGTAGRLSRIELATTIDNKFVSISASIISADMREAKVNGETDRWNTYFSQYMETRAQEDFTRLLTEFQFEKYEIE